MSSMSVFIFCGFLLLIQEIRSRELDQNKTDIIQEFDILNEAQNRSETMNTTAENEPINTRNCVFRIEEGDHLVFSNKTREEIEEDGKIIFDEICEGDPDKDGDRISSGVLASLCCG